VRSALAVLAALSAGAAGSGSSRFAAVDVVTRLDDDRPLALLERWKPHLYIKGGDYRSDSLRSA
jgi:bifunctional ADP-heptose synthase (sugar kinase/adenylyltransferase)